MKNPRRPMGLVPQLTLHREPTLPAKPKFTGYWPLVLITATTPVQEMRLGPDGVFRLGGVKVSDEAAMAWLKAWAISETETFLSTNPEYVEELKQQMEGLVAADALHVINPPAEPKP